MMMKQSAFLSDQPAENPFRQALTAANKAQTQAENQFMQAMPEYITREMIGTAVSLFALMLALSIPEKSPLHTIRDKKRSKNGRK